MDVEFVFWGQSRLLELLSKEKHKGRLYFWFNTNQLTGSKLRSELEETISNASERYTPELHVDIKASDIFEPLGRTPAFVGDVKDRLDALSEEASSLFTQRSIEVLKQADEESFHELHDAIEQIPVLLQDIEQVDTDIPIQELVDTLEQAEQAISSLEPELRTLKEQAEEEQDSVGTTEKHTLNRFRQVQSEVYSFQRYVQSKDLQVAQDPALKLLGEAGMGKTHLLCNVAKDRIEEGYPTVLLLGENFYNRNIWTQIIERFGLTCGTEEFLGALDSLGESRGVRSLIMIDALNESSDPRMWSRQLPGVLRKLENYPHIGICVSCRTGYENRVFESTEDDLIETRHYGFREVEYEAVRKFFDAHGIDHSSIPVLKQEFQVPLFLKLFCENLERQGKSRVSHGPEGISQIFEGYIDGVHERLWRELQYDPSDNKVRTAVEALAREMAEEGGGTKRLPKDKAKQIVNDFLPGRRYPESLYRHILSEGVISEVVQFDEDAGEAVRFSYDKFADHMLAQQYLDLYVDGDFRDALSDSDELQEVFDDPFRYSGLIQALSIHLPEQHNVEIFDFIDSEAILIPFIKSLGWRDPQTLIDSNGDISQEVTDYLWSEIGELDELYELWRVLLTLATSSEHPLNTEYLHGILMEYGVRGRDHDWSRFLHEEFGEDTSEVFRLVNWGFSLENNPIESIELKRLISVTLSWFLCCPNRFLRDRSTKAIVNVVGSDLEIYIDLIERFRGVNDPYILERVYAAAYGGVLRNRTENSVTDIADTVFELEFEDGDPTPHILTRDYARGIIELANDKSDTYSVDLDKIRPPYDSSFSIGIPSPDELRDQVTERLEDADTDLESKFWIGLVGSDFEGGGFSDFARYVVGTNSDSTHVHGYDISGDEALRWITKRVFDLGWHPDSFGEFDQCVNWRLRAGRGTRKPEKFSKKYQWIAYYEFVAWITDDCEFTDSITDTPYSGPWTNWDRNIDPSVLNPEPESDLSIDQVPNYSLRIGDVGTEGWVSDDQEFPEIPNLLEISIDEESWLPLHGTYNWGEKESQESDAERKIVFWIDSVIVDAEDKSELLAWVRQNWVSSDSIQSGLVRLATLTQVFRGEYPWHPVVDDWLEDAGQAIRGSPVDTEKTIIDLHWEAEYDCSIDESYGMFVPSPYLSELLEMEWVVGEKMFMNQSTNPVRIADVSESDGLLDRVNSLTMIGGDSNLLQELTQTGLSIVWLVQGEKRISTGTISGNEFGKSQIRGVYSLNEDGEFTGEIESDFHAWD
ncbi:hypothetical protein C499_09072 [Halogeometricum borinquense DSM 11551]|nr:hypothetical protein C499_09072 [Halogeometricum borinquense DSM 11551]